MLTDLGKMLRNLCTDNDITQEQLAQDLGISAAALSKIVTGQTAPGMELLVGVIPRFNLQGKDIRELFFKAFSSSFRIGQKIEIDPRLFQEERRDTLAQAIVTILLCPGDETYHGDKYKFPALEAGIHSRFNSLEEDVEFNPISSQSIPKL